MFRVIYNLISLQILDRHKITNEERDKADMIVPEYMNPLVKNKAKSSTNLLDISYELLLSK